ncbi:TrmB family transcriptional regulator [Staphylococcus haemolyticus]|uniref:TrmB family transcriptional regulator n=1 Tax=Staphylococcus haemolyticus TaxID=1283 RepID=UPI000FF67A85|nr:TrmB family transcriptional regulator [Staphylococcus haemolyticus]RIO94478.1 TrmB family transcriptional regulator [Staphylococcus haemolyticus]
MTLEQRVLLAFEEVDEFTYKDVAREFQIKHQYAKTILSRLKAKEKIETVEKGTWRVIQSEVAYTTNERKKQVLQEQFEHLAELNYESTDASEIEERIKLMIRLANLF